MAGYSAWRSLPRQEDPIITNRGASILTVFPGASADRVEALVSKKIEDELDEIGAIKHLDSTSRAGFSLVSVELADAVTDETVKPIYAEIRDALTDVAAATLFVISVQGGALHQMSIFGMIIALGLLIDTAIVITDEIRKWLEGGHSRRESVVGALRHLFVPLLSSTLTAVLAFLPILLLPGNAGDFVGSIGGSVIVAVLASFVLSITVIAAFAGLFSTMPSPNAKLFRLPKWMREGFTIPPLTGFMRWLIGHAVKRPLLGIGLGMVVPVVGFVLAGTLGSQFFPRTDHDMFTVALSLPTVTSVEKTDSIAQEAEAMIREHNGVRAVSWVSGASFPPVYYNLIELRDNSSEYTMGVVTADTFATVGCLVPVFQSELEEVFPGAFVQVRKFAQGPPSLADVEIRILGPGLDQLKDLGDEVQRRLLEHPGIIHAESTLTRGEAMLWFRPDEMAARAAGLEPGAIAAQLQTNLEGLREGTMLEGVEELPVRVRVPSERRSEIDALADLRLVGSGGAQVPLRAVGEFAVEPATGAITRRDGERVNIIRGYAAIATLPIEITNEIVAGLESSRFTEVSPESLK